MTIVYDASNLKHVERLAGRLWEEFADTMSQSEDGSDKAWMGRENFINAMCKVADMVIDGKLNRDRNEELRAALLDAAWYRRALVKAVRLLHVTPKGELPEGVVMVDDNEVRVQVDGWWVVARVRRPGPGTPG